MSRLEFLDQYAVDDRHYHTNDEIDKALSSDNFNVRASAARHPKATSEHLGKALNDTHMQHVRSIAANHPNATQEHLDKAINDENRYVRIAAVTHSKATKEHLDKALLDPDEIVRFAAKRSPAYRKYYE